MKGHEKRHEKYERKPRETTFTHEKKTDYEKFGETDATEVHEQKLSIK